MKISRGMNILSYQLSVISYQLSVISYQLIAILSFLPEFILISSLLLHNFQDCTSHDLTTYQPQ
ncbi:hypothetical protein DJ013_12400 [Arcticibacterium luteifluviistationis]|uniref:Uncharacterized protein n=1 Tax=Arcticibacterium luteifluviistationis TaxID=1784714 RepID=A0A2Z4GCA4_9BACT|nr:hypothetical protein DJ013_12400 [Arcticibacterium luteifluviistationis]